MKTREIVFIPMYAALFLILEFISQAYGFLSMPQGGSLELSAIPLIIASYHLGVRGGLLSAFIGLFLRLIFVPAYFLPSANIFYVILQVFFDYILAYSVYGLAKAIPNQVVKNKKSLLALSVLSIASLVLLARWIDWNEQAYLFWACVSLFAFILITSLYYAYAKDGKGITVYWGVILANFIRFMAHNISGWLFFSSYYEGNVLWGVVAYNATYMIPNLVLSLIVTTFIVKNLGDFLNRHKIVE